MTLEPFLQRRREAVQAATGMLQGSTSLLEGIRAMLAFLDLEASQAGRNPEDLDEPHLFLKGIDSEADIYPVGGARDAWEPEALSRNDAQRLQFESAIRRDVLLTCKWFLGKHAG